MARPLRIEFSGAFYHVVSRGNAKQDIFLFDDDRRIFLSYLKHVRDLYHWEIYAYCLMNNHYHLFIQTREANLSIGMQQLNGKYSQRFNRTYERVGHVFQGRFFATLVQSDAYFLELVRYIVLNPVRARFVSNPAMWPWSSYNEVNDPMRAITNVEEILRWFIGNDPITSFRQFILDGIERKISTLHEARGILGDEQFIAAVNSAEIAVQRSMEIPMGERWQGKPTLDEIFSCIEGRNKNERNEAIVFARNSCGHSVGLIAKHLDLHIATISRILSKSQK